MNYYLNNNTLFLYKANNFYCNIVIDIFIFCNYIIYYMLIISR